MRKIDLKLAKVANRINIGRNRKQRMLMHQSRDLEPPVVIEKLLITISLEVVGEEEAEEAEEMPKPEMTTENHLLEVEEKTSQQEVEAEEMIDQQGEEVDLTINLLREVVERSSLRIPGNGNTEMQRDQSTNHTETSKLMQAPKLSQCLLVMLSSKGQMLKSTELAWNKWTERPRN